MQSGEHVTDTVARRLASPIVSRHHAEWRRAPFLNNADSEHEDRVSERYDAKLTQVRGAVFQKLPLTRRTKQKLLELAVCVATRRAEDALPPGSSGIVVAGYGTGEYYPSLFGCRMYGLLDGLLNYDIGPDIRVADNVTAAVVPFAQSEMVQTFMEGIDPDYARSIDEQLSVLFGNYSDVLVDNIPDLSDTVRSALKRRLRELGMQLLGDYMQTLNDFRRSTFVDPVIDIVASLPKDELAAMAESLVNLTSFKRRVSRQAETVGGPIDVAVLSKGDGFIWIRRKHYFKPELNPSFFANYFEGV